MKLSKIYVFQLHLYRVFFTGNCGKVKYYISGSIAHKFLKFLYLLQYIDYHSWTYITTNFQYRSSSFDIRNASQKKSDIFTPTKHLDCNQLSRIQKFNCFIYFGKYTRDMNDRAKYIVLCIDDIYFALRMRIKALQQFLVLLHFFKKYVQSESQKYFEFQCSSMIFRSQIKTISFYFILYLRI